MKNCTEVFSIELPTGGQVTICRWRFQSENLPQDKPMKRMSIVAGIRGDAPEGMRIAYRLLQTLQQLEGDLHVTLEYFITKADYPIAFNNGSKIFELEVSGTIFFLIFLHLIYN